MEIIYITCVKLLYLHTSECKMRGFPALIFYKLRTLKFYIRHILQGFNAFVLSVTLCIECVWIKWCSTTCSNYCPLILYFSIIIKVVMLVLCLFHL